METEPGPSPAAPRRTAKREERRRTRRALAVLGLLLGLIFAGVIASVGFVVYSAQKALDKATDGKGGSVIQVMFPGPAQPAQSSRTSILIAGNSYDDPGHPGGDLTDGILIATFDSVTNKTGLVSVPRDLWVTYNGKNMKINAVYVSAGRGQAGLNALGQVVETVTGLHIDQHVLVGVTAFQGMVDAVGGIDITINSPDPRGIGDPNVGLFLPNGPQHLDGKTALTLARARNDPIPGKEAYGLPDSDYSRQQSQRLILLGIIAKIKSTPTLANPLTVTTLFEKLSDSMKTDLTASQIRPLYDQLVKSGNPVTFTIRGPRNASLLTDYNSNGAGDALVPKAGIFDYTAIQSYVTTMLAG